MKQKIAILLFIFLEIIISLNAQGKFLFDDKHWIFLTHQENDAGVNILSGFVVNVKGDSIIDDKHYKKMYAYSLKGEHNCQFPPCFTPNYPYEIGNGRLYALLRENEQTGIVYHYGQTGDNCIGEYELFNFSQIAGDTINSCVRQKIFIKDGDGIIDSVTTSHVYNAQRKVQYTSGERVFEELPFSGELRIVEGIGFELYGFFGGTQDELIEVCFGTFDECNIISSVKQIDQRPEVNIYPNSVYEKLNINSEIKIKKVSIVDSSGRRVWSNPLLIKQSLQR